MLRLLHFVNNDLTVDSEAVCLLPPERMLLTISVTDWVDPRAIVQLVGLSRLKKSKDPNVNRTHNIPACRILS
jgi:hypothetical protein